MTLSTQESKKTKCEHGVNFGFEGCRVWVDKGARGWFKVKYVKQDDAQGERAYGASRSASWVWLVIWSVGRSVGQSCAEVAICGITISSTIVSVLFRR